ncbi:CPXCG motif-containing cysteine-rich protein [Pontibacter sp. JAM-7]|uniref:CPXCG motif-containing cysteine-rich protein n=1 Tax=Pontibacter sp. JAM-7 TaxID=3366581 RepID=UPI003AF83DF1
MMQELNEVEIGCPYCGELITVLIEVLADSQEYIEDCQVCCRPIVFHISTTVTGEVQITVHAENDTF